MFERNGLYIAVTFFNLLLSQYEDLKVTDEMKKKKNQVYIEQLIISNTKLAN